MKEKTFEEFKNDFVIEKGFCNWDAFVKMAKKHNPPSIPATLEKIATLYANYAKAIVFEKACKAQKKIHAKDLSNRLGKHIDSNVIGYHSQLIPSADNPYKTKQLAERQPKNAHDESGKQAL